MFTFTNQPPGAVITMTVADDVIPVLKIGSFVSLFPFYDRKKRAFKRIIVYNALINATSLAYMFYSRIAYYRELGGSILLYHLPGVLNTCANIVTSISLSSWNYRGFVAVFRDFNQFDEVVNAVFKIGIGKVRFVAGKIIFMHLILSVIVAYDAWINFIDDYIKYLIHSIFQFYFMFIYALLEHCLIASLYIRFKLLNDAIEDGRIRNDLDEKKMDAAMRLHLALFSIVERFNAIFGLHIFLTNTQIFIRLLGVIQSYLYIGVQWDSIILLLMWNAYILGQGVAIATNCEQVANEGQRTIKVAFKTFNHSSHSRQYRRKTLILIHQSSARLPVFTAAGFFRVDFSMIFTFVNLITTYTIVIIQFLSQTDRGFRNSSQTSTSSR